jgi:hypothetical protein
VAWFKKNTTTDSDSSVSFPTRSVRQVVIFSQKTNGKKHPAISKIVVVHLETQEGNDLWMMLKGEWTVYKTEGREFATTVMGNLLGGPENLVSAGLLTAVDSGRYLSSSFGFGGEVYANKVPDSLFIAISLADKLAQGWVPSETEDLEEVYDVFSDVPLFVGFFAPFKQILKRLTEVFQENQQEMSIEFRSRFAGALGRGYSVVDARLADGEKRPSDKYSRAILAISSLPVLEGFRWPRMATLQFLSRKGLRLLKFLESQPNPIVAARFRANYLSGPQLNVSLESRLTNGNFDLEDHSLTYQQLLTHILFGHLGLVKKDREARRVTLGPRWERHSLQLGSTFLESLDEGSREVYATWINEGSYYYSKHAPIARHALAISKVIPSAEFVWNRETAALIANSDSEELQREALKAQIENPQWSSIFNAESFGRALEWLDEEYIEFFFRLEARPNKTTMISDWVLGRATSTLTNREVLIALQILKISWLSKPRASLLFQLIKQGKLDPSQADTSWPPFFSYSRWASNAHDEILEFFGISSILKPPVGVLDAVNLKDEGWLEFFSGMLATYLANLQSYDKQGMLEILSRFAASSKPGALALLKRLAHDQKLQASRVEILNLLHTAEPTGQAVLDFLERELEKPIASHLLDALVLTGDDSFSTFWRRNAKEVEQLLSRNNNFPSFFWTNFEALPLLVRENILSYSGFGLKVLESLQPSSIAKMNSAQEELIIKLTKKHPEIFSKDVILRAMLVASSLRVNQPATDHVKAASLFPSYWLVMLESNLPYPQAAALAYLESQVLDSKFADTLLMALDSNNQQARTLAIRVLRSVKTPDRLQQILRALVENRNSDTWSIVSSNLQKLDDPAKLKEFTRQVFLSRRKSRNVKEKIKTNVDSLIDNIESAVEQDVLLRMAFSSVAQDREWALKQIAQHQSDIAGVLVETSWKSGLNV